ncbi:hypothetical protein A5881_000514 [Enterococcus termitis]
MSRRKKYKKQNNPISEDENSSQEISLNTNERSLIFDGKDIVHLTTLEFKIATLLFQNIGELVTYKELHQSIIEENELDDSHFYRVTNLVCHIRKKISTKVKEDPIKTIRSKGYILDIKKRKTNLRSFAMYITEPIIVTGKNLQSQPISGRLFSIYERTCIVAEDNGTLHLTKLSLIDSIPKDILSIDRKVKFHII